ncbi:RFX-type winged-helix domain-containing protein [Mycena venus]|uniref:RFX-type winged-helix domain-containing protein n=1 Tax=Mycena venus TaxID=2733690 RepID=A0A8H7CW73_9AGAR|nr:RFX-type winged-helix domain-containing protein [Mycena venus]
MQHLSRFRLKSLPWQSPASFMADFYTLPTCIPIHSIDQRHRKRPHVIEIKARRRTTLQGIMGSRTQTVTSPFRLTNLTLDFIEKKWASEIDFVIWTGDNARHDNDRKLPRTPTEIYDLNRAVAGKMNSVFTSRGIPVIPSLGNNDVWPHNIMIPGPNSITNEFASIWKAFIPFPYLQIFQRGAYYAVEVIPDSVAVISLNTMYFYDSNKAVGGCVFKDRDDAGNLQFDWLEVQLKGFRARGMQVRNFDSLIDMSLISWWRCGYQDTSLHLQGIISRNAYVFTLFLANKDECFAQYVRYVELALRFQDTIVGHLFGHMNADHFFFLEANDLEIIEPATVKNNGELFDTLLSDFAAMPKAKDISLDDYAVINVSPSVVPNPYLPSFRVFSYNITGTASSLKNRKHGHHHGNSKDKQKQCKLDMYRETWRCQLNETWHSDPNAPSRTNQLWTPLGYAQYYIPHLEEGNKTHVPKFKLEYVTYGAEALQGSSGFYPVPPKNLPSTLKNRHTAYGLEDLTVGSWVALARRMSSSKKLKSFFKTYMYMTR